MPLEAPLESSFAEEPMTERQPLDPEAQARRDFLKKIGTASATAPAVALLLAANAKTASAQSPYGGGGSGSGSS
jgi:hypothetical protein